MIVYHLLRVCIHLCVGLFSCAVVFPCTDASGRDWRIRRWSQQLLKICGVRVEVNQRDATLVPGAVVVANHISWLDIFVINAMQPCRFVAKSDIRDWPVVGWLCDKAGTIFIARGNRRDVSRIFKGLVASIHAGERVAFFPEGTTAAQGTLLPFHANLFEAAIDAEVPIQPYALRYLDAAGRHHSAVEFIGDMSFAQSMIAILKARNISAHLKLLPSIDVNGAHRRALAADARQAVAQALGVTLMPEVDPSQP
ncbi:lysophospholipid acyltransferase family protein [Undibacterium arcticum]|uniref:Lysophospholipid acyltransferase family protein n=1 Tax=Undibacterium arcticum TaxID=1762892 RepID=A0ABV7F7F9_9BURK